jgi:hypothetical protein
VNVGLTAGQHVLHVPRRALYTLVNLSRKVTNQCGVAASILEQKTQTARNTHASQGQRKMQRSQVLHSPTQTNDSTDISPIEIHEANGLSRSVRRVHQQVADIKIAVVHATFV